MVLEKKLFEEFQDGCLVHGHLWYLNGMVWAIQGLRFALMPPIKFLLKRLYGFEEELFKVLKIAAMLAHNNDSVGCESTIPSLMPTKLSHCALQICRWFLEFLTVKNSYLTTLSFWNKYMAKPFYTHWYYTTRQHTKTLFCGEIIIQYL